MHNGICNLPGKCVFTDLVKVNMNPNLLRQHLWDKQCPQPRPVFKLGTAYVYDEIDSDKWAQEFLAYKAAAPERAAARKAEQQRLREAEQIADMARIKKDFEIQRAHEAAQEQFLADREAWVESINRGQ